jgi:hypothetical protein
MSASYGTVRSSRYRFRYLARLAAMDAREPAAEPLLARQKVAVEVGDFGAGLLMAMCRAYASRARVCVRRWQP